MKGQCHGTGTAVGDPLEIEAIRRVFAEHQSREDKLLIGSVRSTCPRLSFAHSHTITDQNKSRS